MSTPKQPTTEFDFNDEDSNVSDNLSFDQIFAARVSRRDVLKTTALYAAGAAVSGLSLSALQPVEAKEVTGGFKLGFNPVAKSLADKVVVPDGYQVSVIYALGDPLKEGVPAYQNDGTDEQFEHRSGDHHDGMEWFGLSDDGQPSHTSNTRGLLGVNHEATTDEKLSSFFIHANGGTSTLPRPAAEVDKELAIHGISIVEVRNNNGQWSTVQNSPFNARITQNTTVEISGPAKGHVQLKTKYSPNGTQTRGTLNNCGTGTTPWGSMVTGEENWFGYFTRSEGDDAARGDKSVVALNRYGRKKGAASRHGWESAGAEDRFVRWNNSKLGMSVDGSDDYRNEMNTMGYVVEIDPYNKARSAKKRTSLGRFAHESASFSIPKARQPLHVYMGDDARNEYIYKFVTQELWDPADAKAVDKLAVGDKYLDKGTLYAARFDASGKGEWLELSMSNPKIAEYKKYTFSDAGDIAINARLAADAVGATKMDRPEWNGVNPANGEVYFTLTNNSNRTAQPNPEEKSQLLPDASNPRAYVDMKKDKAQKGNPNGHILRLRDSYGRNENSFKWDVYLFGAQADADSSTINLSGLTDDQDFSSPDGLAFSKNTGICWIQTDDGAYTDASNCMMLAAIPGRVGDGSSVTIMHKNADGTDMPVTTFVGKKPSAAQLKRFLVGPKGCEITGLCETPDGKAIFVNIQHPGENTKQADLADAAKYESQWPANAGYGKGSRPRSATIVITRKDGGAIGS